MPTWVWFSETEKQIKKAVLQYKIMLFTTTDDLKVFSVFNKHFADRFLYTNLPYIAGSQNLLWIKLS